MAVTLDASTSAGLIQTADTSGVISLLNNGTAGLTLTSGNLQFNSGYGSVATAYGCRAWVNFNGTGTVAIRASGNVSSITDGGVGTYTVNITNAMPDTNYATVAVLGIGGTSTSGGLSLDLNTTNTTTAKQIITYLGNALYDSSQIQVAIFR